jgi:hypothetical protein
VRTAGNEVHDYAQIKRAGDTQLGVATQVHHVSCLWHSIHLPCGSAAFPATYFRCTNVLRAYLSVSLLPLTLLSAASHIVSHFFEYHAVSQLIVASRRKSERANAM